MTLHTAIEEAKKLKEKWEILVFDIFLKSKPKAQKYPLGQLNKRGWDFIQEALTSQYTRGEEAVMGRVDIAIKFGTLPDPNPFGKWVSVKNHNRVVKDMERMIKSPPHSPKEAK